MPRDACPRGRLIFGTSAHNPHVQNMARALYERGLLEDYVTGGVDRFKTPVARWARRIAGALPAVESNLSRRAIVGLPDDYVTARWGWELPRAIASSLRLDPRLVDWLWERGERALDRACAERVASADIGGFFGVEFGALASLQTARRSGKTGIVAFLSPHHSAYQRYVGSELRRFPELAPAGHHALSKHDTRRDAVRDDEAKVASWIVSGSSFTSRSLAEAGIDAQRIITVPLGGPDPVAPSRLPKISPSVLRVIYAGPVSVRKGAHHLLAAWQKASLPDAELHLFGKVLLPDAVCRTATHRVTFHGSIPAQELNDIYLNASVLILPTLCDGFGQVVSDALAHGLPVITTRNAGAADLIDEGVNGFLVEPASTGAIVERLQWCSDHRDRLFGMRQPSLASAARWTWVDFRQSLGAKIEEALSGDSAQTQADSHARRRRA